MKCCRLCAIELESQIDFNLVNGSGEFRPIDAISQLPFTIENKSPYVCRTCKSKLKSYVQSKEKTRKIEEELRFNYNKSGSATSTTNSTKNVNEKESRTCSKESQTNLSFSHDKNNETVAYVHVCWPSGDRSRKLPSDLTKMAIYLLRTQNKNVATFAFKHPLMRIALLELIEKQVHKECQEMCREYIKVPGIDQSDNSDAQGTPKSRRDLFRASQKRKADDHNQAASTKKFVKRDVRSVFKKTTKDDLMKFTFQKANEELQERCPLFWLVLNAASRPHNKNKVNNDVSHSTAIVTAASVCLKNRSQRMTAVQLLISLIINHSSYTVSIIILLSHNLYKLAYSKSII